MNLDEFRSLYDFSGRTILITGGTGVLAWKNVTTLAQCNANVVVLSSNHEQGSMLMAENLKSVKGRALHVYVDVLSPESLQQANETIQAELGALDILINAAGGNHPAATTKPDLSFFDLPLDALRHVGDLNLSPMNRFGTPKDLLGATLWLISPAAPFVIGVVIPIDGGFSAFSGV